MISDPYPPSGSTGISLTPMLNISVDAEEETMNITWWSNSSGSWQVFGTNNSVIKGTYHQTFSNATTNGQWWYWKVNVTTAEEYNESGVFSFYTGNESKFNNTGSTNISGYLLMQIEYLNESSQEWKLEQIVINDATPRVINSGSVLALDKIFNERRVNTETFEHGNGTYRVYAAFRDPDGDVLVCGDQTSLIATYAFSVTFD